MFYRSKKSRKQSPMSLHLLRIKTFVVCCRKRNSIEKKIFFFFSSYLSYLITMSKTYRLFHTSIKKSSNLSKQMFFIYSYIKFNKKYLLTYNMYLLMFLTCFNFKCSKRKRKKHGNKRIKKTEFQTKL